MKNIKIKFNNLTLYFILIALLSGYIKSALIVLFIILFHELGHILTSLLLGYKISLVEIFPFGGITKIEKLLNTKIYKDLLIAFSGVLFQLIIHFLCIFKVLNDPLIYNYNLSIMLFNLLPIIPLDGSKIVFELLNYYVPYKKSLIVYTFVSFMFIFFYILFNYQYELNNYMIVILFICKSMSALKKRKIIHQKFILERFLYDIEYDKIKNCNTDVDKYQKSKKYYYRIDNKVVCEKEYLMKYYTRSKWF